MKRQSKSITRAAGFDKLDRPIKAWLSNNRDMMEHDDAAIFFMDAWEEDFKKYWKIHRPGEEFLHPYEWFFHHAGEPAKDV